MGEKQDNIEDLVLAGALISKECHIDCADLISDKDFLQFKNQAIFSVIAAIHERDMSTSFASFMAVSQDLGLQNVIQGLEPQINKLKSLDISPNDVRKFAQRLKKRSIIRHSEAEHRNAIEQLQEMTLDSRVSQILSVSEKPLFNTLKKFSAEDSKPVNPAEKYEKILHKCETIGADALGIETPWPLFNASIGGRITNGAVHLIGARSGIGKTFIGLIQGIYTAKQGIPVLFLDSEMSEEEFFFRGLSSFSQVAPWDIKAGNYVDNDFKKKAVYTGAEEFKKIPFHRKDTAQLSFDEILATIRRWIYTDVGFNDEGKAKTCLIIYDYFKLMDTSQLKSIAETQALGFQIMDLISLTKKYEIPCLAFIQLNRDGIVKETSDVISQSDRILWNCRSFSIFKPKSEEEVEHDGVESGNRKIITVKSSFGGEHTYGNYINYNFDPASCSMEELSTRNNLEKTNNDEQEETAVY